MNAPFATNEVQPLGVADAMRRVKRIRNELLAAVFSLDDDGVECFAVTELYGLAADLVAEFEGRRRPYYAWPHSFPDWAAAHAAEWRAERARKERRR